MTSLSKSSFFFFLPCLTAASVQSPSCCIQRRNDLLSTPRAFRVLLPGSWMSWYKQPILASLRKCLYNITVTFCKVINLHFRFIALFIIMQFSLLICYTLVSFCFVAANSLQLAYAAEIITRDCVQ